MQESRSDTCINEYNQDDNSSTEVNEADDNATIDDDSNVDGESTSQDIDDDSGGRDYINKEDIGKYNYI